MQGERVREEREKSSGSSYSHLFPCNGLRCFRAAERVVLRLRGNLMH